MREEPRVRFGGGGANPIASPYPYQNPGAIAAQPMLTSPGAVDPTAIELSFWESIKNSTNPDDFKAYLDKYPDGQFVSLAKLRSQPTKTAANPASLDTNSLEMTYWNAIKDSKSASDFRAYVAKFPMGSLWIWLIAELRRWSLKRAS